MASITTLVIAASFSLLVGASAAFSGKSSEYAGGGAGLADDVVENNSHNRDEVHVRLSGV